MIATNFPAGVPAIKLGDIAVIAYPSGSISILSVDENGHNQKQVAYFDIEKKQWFREGSNPLHADQPIWEGILKQAKPTDFKDRTFIEQLGEEQI